MAIVVENLGYTYSPSLPWERRVLHDVSFILERGQILGLWGGNGAGKSTLMRLMCGILTPDRGTVTVDGQDLKPRGPRKKAGSLQVAMAMQYPENQLYESNIARDIAAGLVSQALPAEQLQARVEAVARRFFGSQASDILQKAACQLSGGQKRLAALASVLILDCPYILLDEPMEGLDLAGNGILSEILLHEARAEQRGIVIAAHRMQELLPLCDRLLWLDDGQVRSQGECLETLRAIESAGPGTAPAAALPNGSGGLTASRQVLYCLRAKGCNLPLEARNACQAAAEIEQALKRRG